MKKYILYNFISKYTKHILQIAFKLDVFNWWEKIMFIIILKILKKKTKEI